MPHDDGPEPVTLIVDGANVMGSRADGWWRDPAAAMARLHAELGALAARGIQEPPPDGSPEPAVGRWFPCIMLVVEGRARGAVGLVTEARGVQVVAAEGAGDDEIARLAASVPGRRVVITADRELRRRCQRAGAAVAGPRWLFRQLA